MTIGKLPDKVLLEIFRYHLDAFPRLWPRLVHICRRWRRIVLSFQRTLDLRLFCTHGISVLKALDYWPTQPIVVNFGGSSAFDPPAPEDEDNITAALKKSARVVSITIAVTSSLLGKLSAIEGPFSKLENLVLMSRLGDSVQLTLPSSFRCGPRLRRLHLTGIVFPALLQCISSSRNLVDLQLHPLEIFHTKEGLLGELSPEVFANALSGTPQLQSLSLHFPSATYAIYPRYRVGERVLLPALSRLSLRGISGNLDGFVARIDTPGLRDIKITFLDERIFDVPKLRHFIDRLEIQKSHRQADILSSKRGISISLTQPGDTSCLSLHVLCKKLFWQPFIMAHLCTYLSAFLLRVEDLRINTTRRSSRQDDPDRNREQWFGIFREFGSVKWFHAGGGYSTSVVRALQLSDERCEPVLPTLRKLCIQEPEPRPSPLREAIVSFIHSCWLSGRFIAVAFENLSNGGLPRTGITYA